MTDLDNLLIHKLKNRTNNVPDFLEADGEGGQLSCKIGDHTIHGKTKRIYHGWLLVFRFLCVHFSPLRKIVIQ